MSSSVVPSVTTPSIPIQEKSIEYARVLIRQDNAQTRDDAMNGLIEALGGDATNRQLKLVGWDEARDSSPVSYAGEAGPRRTLRIGFAS